MKTRKINPWWGAAALTTIASLLVAGALLFSKTPIAPPAPIAASVQPETRVTPITIEGQPIEVELKLFDQKQLPFTTYAPAKDFQSSIGASGEGQSIRFYFSPTGQKDESAYIHIFLPASLTELEDLRQLVLGDNGLMASSQWELTDRTDIVSYPWAKEKLTYQQQTPNGLVVGTIYIGENQGKAFYLVTHYPAEYTDGFEPRSAVILENLKFRE
jgi:hypothetical protein